MGCLNSNQGFEHWFGNVHLSGPCNRACYFCIGQHMMALDPLNNLDKWPLDNLEEFIAQCKEHNVTEINVTGSDTDPLLYKHPEKLREYLASNLPGLVLGLRTNGALALENPDVFNLYDKASISVTSFNPELYRITMGNGDVPDLERIMQIFHGKPLKLNVVLCPETLENGDLFKTLDKASELGIQRVNMREPYGQPHIGDPLAHVKTPSKTTLGMPTYIWNGSEVTYWDVHFVEVESVNLYANGRVSVLYPITAGHCPTTGSVKGQEHFDTSGRLKEQWKSFKKSRSSFAV